MSTFRLTTGQALVKFLNQQYVEVDGQEEKFVHGVFTIFGHGNVLGLGQALEQDSGDLIVHQGCNEQGMAQIAVGFAKQQKRKKIYAVSASVGPGCANMITAAATASANRIPVLLLPSDVYASRQPDPVIQQIEQFHDYSITTNDAFRPVSKFFDRVMRPEQLMTAMINAMRVLTDPADTGAVTISLPQDVQGESYDFPEHFFQKRVHRIERRPASTAMIADAVAAIKDKKKPLLICGGGVRYSEAHDTFKAFAEKFNIPFGETQAGKSAVPFDHELNCGGIGSTGTYSANILAKEADVIIGVGTRMTDFTTASKSQYQNKEVTFVNINVASHDAYKLDGIRVVADAKSALEVLSDALEKENYRSEYTDQITTARKTWAEELNRLDNVKYEDNKFEPEVAGHLDNSILDEYADVLKSKLLQTRVLGILNKEFSDDAIVVGAAGSLPADLQRVWRPKQKDTYHVEFGYSCMGYEIAAAIGAKISCPEQPVYALLGDGSYMMLHSELQTAIQEGIKIDIVLMDNMSFGCINNLQMDNGMGSFGTENRFRDAKTGKLTGKSVPVDFAKNAESYGCVTYTVRNDEELIAAIADAKKQTVSTLIDVKVLPKTMTHGYESWWRCGIAEVADKAQIEEAAVRMSKMAKSVRQY
ncbi:3D-(3,5/4)-trihydroxycyclohexane-1,2-dione acylhydrolase (decyclizing) [Vibrio sp. WJH972]